MFLNSLGGLQGLSLFEESLRRRISAPGWLTVAILLGMAFSYLLVLLKPKRIHRNQFDDSQESESEPIKSITQTTRTPAQDFALILILMGGLLVLFTEFFYLLDQFGTRMNTVFKFYYQTWIFWGLAAAFATAVLLRELRRFWAILFRIGLAILLIVAFAYPLFSLWNKTNGFNPTSGFSLDGAAYMQSRNPDEAAGIQWLQIAPPGVVLEAVGTSYSEFARVATLSGQQNVLGWPGHERQWRGGGEEIGNREGDVEIIYRSNNWEEAKSLLDLYNVRYIYIGPLERLTYRVSETKFQSHLGEPVFNSGEVSIYEIPREDDTTRSY
jgi:uncharacterized membrane protein